MPKVLVLYYSASGNTKKMAEEVLKGAQAEKVSASIASVEAFRVDGLLEPDGIIIGSPCYYGTMAAPVKALFDESVKFHGKLEGKVGGAFCSSANVGGGNETTILDILNAMLIHGMVVKGSPTGDHYGPVAIGSPDSRALKECNKLGRDLARLVLKLAGK